VEVKLLKKGADGVMVFEPAFEKIAPGETVKFLATDKGHNVESVKDMLPEGATPSDWMESGHGLISSFARDLRTNASHLSPGKAGFPFSGSCLAFGAARYPAG
jgi:plastocyanin